MISPDRPCYDAIVFHHAKYFTPGAAIAVGYDNVQGRRIKFMVCNRTCSSHINGTTMPLAMLMIPDGRLIHSIGAGNAYTRVYAA
jgi:hypothetical protein